MTGKKSHLLVRFSPDHDHPAEEWCDALPMSQMHHQLLHSVEHLSSDIGDLGSFAVIAAADQEPLTWGTDLLDDVLLEISLRESAGGAHAPTMVCDPLLAHRLGTFDDESYRDKYNAKLLDAMRRGADVGLHFVAGLNFVNAGEGRTAFEALSRDVRDEFMRITLTDDAHPDAMAAGAEFAAILEGFAGIESKRIPHSHVHDATCACFDGMACPDCGSDKLLVSTFIQIRAEIGSYGPVTQNTLTELMDEAGEGGRIVSCPDCGVNAVVTEEE